MADTPKKRVLIVDDAGLVRAYYRAAIEPTGVEVDEALNGLEALEKLLVKPADLLIVDVNMPMMDGMTFLKTLRSRALPVSATPALMISTEAAPQDRAAALAAGANFYLVKPIAQNVLADYVVMFCGGRG